MSDDIPPPLIPDPPPESIGDHLYVPYLLADAPRLQLDFLSRHTALPQSHRQAIREWLHNYNTRLLKWLYDTYGEEAVRAAEALSREAGQKIMQHQRQAQEKLERSIFDKLAEEMRDDESE